MSKATRRDKDYSLIRLQYVQGLEGEGGKITRPTLNQLAELHRIPPAYLRSRAGAEKWTAERNKFQAKVFHETTVARAKAVGSKAAILDTEAADIALDALKNIRREMTRLGRARRARKPMDVDRLKTLVTAAKEAQALGRVALGQPLDPGGIARTGVTPVDVSGLSDDQLRLLAGVVGETANMFHRGDIIDVESERSACVDLHPVESSGDVTPANASDALAGPAEQGACVPSAPFAGRPRPKTVSAAFDDFVDRMRRV